VTEIVQNWIIKATHDYKIAMSELKTEDPAFDMICYHFQQCVEKYLKAWLVMQNVEIRKTHNINIILEQCRLKDASFSELVDKGIGSLTIYASDTLSR
jgi:HEPN domain-containing protein